MSTSTQPDDLEAVRTITSALAPFDKNVQERILKWTREKLGLSVNEGSPLPPAITPAAPVDTHQHGPKTVKTIKEFVNEKQPSSNNEFAAVVAYFYRFEAAGDKRRDTINADDLQEACRLAGRSRLQKPAQTLVNAHKSGLVDKAGDRGAYSISTVGENLVAMALPSGGGTKTKS